MWQRRAVAVFDWPCPLRSIRSAMTCGSAGIDLAARVSRPLWRECPAPARRKPVRPFARRVNSNRTRGATGRDARATSGPAASRTAVRQSCAERSRELRIWTGWSMTGEFWNQRFSPKIALTTGCTPYSYVVSDRRFPFILATALQTSKLRRSDHDKLGRVDKDHDNYAFAARLFAGCHWYYSSRLGSIEGLCTLRGFCGGRVAEHVKRAASAVPCRSA